MNEPLPPLTEIQAFAKAWLDAYGPLTPGDGYSIGCLAGLIGHCRMTAAAEEASDE